MADKVIEWLERMAEEIERIYGKLRDPSVPEIEKDLLRKRLRELSDCAKKAHAVVSAQLEKEQRGRWSALGLG
jgi:hypothetical protein